MILLSLTDIFIASVIMAISNYFFFGSLLGQSDETIWFSTCSAIGGFVYAYLLVKMRIHHVVR